MAAILVRIGGLALVLALVGTGLQWRLEVLERAEAGLHRVVERMGQR